MRSLLPILLPLSHLLTNVRSAPTPHDSGIFPLVGGEDVQEQQSTKRSLIKRATWSPVQGGCWQDNADRVRALNHFQGNIDDLTPEKCQAVCEAQGFSLAGVEYSRECYCGNSIFGNNHEAPVGNCNMNCAGDASKKCGGPDALNLYVKDNFPFTTGPASPLNSYNGYTSTQCWHDDASNRDLKASPATPIPPSLMTIQKCIDGCAAAGYSSAGVEEGKDCYCGNISFPPAATANIEDCNTPCEGDASTYCGGRERIIIYNNPNTANPQWLPAQGGCWSDNVDHLRAFDHGAGSYNDLTPTKCQNICDNLGFNLAGVEYGRECYCGNTVIGNNRPTSASLCNAMTCSGDQNQYCGGPDAIIIYVKNNYPFTVGPPSVVDTYNGYEKTECWQDNTSNRLLKQSPAAPIPADQMTVQKCIDGCSAAGYSSAGLEYGRECYCDNVTFPVGQSTDIGECGMPCLGDASEFCGGRERILIYNKPVVPPCVTNKQGVVQVRRASDNVLMGYIRRQYDGQNSYTYGTLANALTVSLPSAGPFTGAIDITGVNPVDAAHPLVGAVGGSAGYNFNPGQLGYTYLSGTGHTNANSPPSFSAGHSIQSLGYNAPAESQVWSIDCSSKEITGQWTNTDGSQPSTSIFYDTNVDFLGLIGDINKFVQTFPNENAYPVKFYFVPS